MKYAEVKKLNRRLLEKAFARFLLASSNEDRQSSFRKFCEEESAWLDDYAFFRALMEKNGERENWDVWPYQSLEAARDWLDGLSPEQQSAFAQRRDFFRYVQWIAHEQWRDLKAFADERGVALMGDIPFGVSYYSADVFSRPNEFALDWSGGAPPEPYFKDDEFTQKWGQNWGIPLYRWDAMRTRKFDWWRQRVRGVSRHLSSFSNRSRARVLPNLCVSVAAITEQRISAARLGPDAGANRRTRAAFCAANDATSQDCEANGREGEEYLRAILEECGDARVVGEDLGDRCPITFGRICARLGIAGFKIPQWEVYGGRVTPGSEYERLSVATYATHDHKPLRELWEEAIEWPTSTHLSEATTQQASDQARQALNKIARFAGFQPRTESPDFGKDFYPAIMEALFQERILDRTCDDHRSARAQISV